ncbi:alpha-ribazole phosphatase [Bacillaceae bacterium]
MCIETIRKEKRKEKRILRRWIWVRHGETAENAAGRYLGHRDVPLNERGRRQAQALANKLAGETIASIYTSDLRRCVETARAIAREHGPLTPLPAADLRELNFGEWDGKTYDQLMRTEKARVEQWYADPFTTPPPGGETLRELGMRIDRFLAVVIAATETAAGAARPAVVFVTHGGPIRWFLSRWVKGEETAFWQVKGLAPGEGLVAEFDGRSWVTQRWREGEES